MALGFVLLFAGCQRDEIKTYRVAKEAPPPAAASPSSTKELPPGHPPLDASMSMPSGQAPAAAQYMADIPVPTGTEDLSWTAPASWQAKPLGQMRKGSFALTGAEGTADLSIFVFPGTTGGLIDNVNRWRGQIGLAPLNSTELPANLSSLKTESGLELVVVDMANPEGKRIIGALLVRDSQSWFFKLAGPKALLDKEKDGFIAFLKTVKAR